MVQPIRPTTEQVEKLYPKTIVYNKLNKLIIARRREMENNFQKDCPFCRGEDPGCNYFSPFLAETAIIESSSQRTADSQWVAEAQTFLEKIRGALAGQVITVKASLIEYDFDLGANLSLAKRYLNLYAAYPELPFLSDLGNRLGFYPRPIGENSDQDIQSWIPFPSLLIRSAQFDFGELTKESCAELTNWYRTVLNDQSETGQLYLGLQLIPIDPDDDPWGNIIPENTGEKTPYFAEIVDIRSYLRLEKYIFQRLSDIEERILSRQAMNKPGESEYPCSNLEQLHKELRHEYTEIVETVKFRINEWR